MNSFWSFSYPNSINGCTQVLLHNHDMICTSWHLNESRYLIECLDLEKRGSEQKHRPDMQRHSTPLKHSGNLGIMELLEIFVLDIWCRLHRHMISGQQEEIKSNHFNMIYFLLSLTVDFLSNSKIKAKLMFEKK